MALRKEFIEIESYINNLGYNILTKKYQNSNTQLIITDSDGFYYRTTYGKIYGNHKPDAFNKSNPYTIQNIKLWCKLNHKPYILLSNTYIDSDKNKLKWKCLKDNCQEVFMANWGHIISNKGCPYCASQKSGQSNCLATKNPELSKEWHPIKNGNITPHDVLPNSNKQIWWQCAKNPKHEWQSNVLNRNNGNGCPYCNGTFASEDYNVYVCHPNLMTEWNYNKNKIHPTEYTPSSGYIVWWKCQNCNHEWESRIVDRVKGIGCPKCNFSKGEDRVNNYFRENAFKQISQKEYDKLIDKSLNNYFICQKKFKGLFGINNGMLSYDFYIPIYNLLIEFQGEQHERFCNRFYKSQKDFSRQQEHDKRKKEYALNNNINLLEIWYYDFDNIEQILDTYINNLTK